MESRQRLGEVVSIARAAGRRIMSLYAGPFTVVTKADASPVTEADLAAHAIILDRLAALDPDLPVLSEESPGVTASGYGAGTRHWMVDPLDGTREFIARNDQFTVNIALIDTGTPVLGVVHSPATDRTWFAVAGGGALRQDGDDTPRPIHASTRCRTPPVITASRSHAGPALRSYLDWIGEHEMLALGSALKFGLMAEGGADCYPRPEPTSHWDTAAGHCVAEASGCTVVCLDGSPLRYELGSGFLNPGFVVFADGGRDWLPSAE